MWPNVFFFIFLHIFGTYGVFKIFLFQMKFLTCIYSEYYKFNIDSYWWSISLDWIHFSEYCANFLTWMNKQNKNKQFLISVSLLCFMLLAILISYIVGISLTVGAHRLWSHRSFKVTLPLKIALLVVQTSAGQVINNK